METPAPPSASDLGDDPALLVLPMQSQEDTDVGWGEPAEPDDEHLYRERPPHWDSG